jgi:hypothetical protein
VPLSTTLSAWTEIHAGTRLAETCQVFKWNFYQQIIVVGEQILAKGKDDEN